MSDIEKIQTDMRKRLKPHIDEAYLDKISELVHTGWQVMGVRVPQIRAVTKDLYQAYPAVTIDDIMELVDDAFQEQIREEALCGIYWLTTKQKQFDIWLWPLIDRWVEGIVDWEVCDLLAAGVAAPIVHHNLQLVDQLVNWANFPNQWRRRFAVSTAAALNQKKRAHVPETLRICHELMEEEEAIVRKAVGWALREASKHDTEAVFEFLRSWKGNGNKTIIREGGAKLSEAQRQMLLS